MRKTDISKYAGSADQKNRVLARSAAQTAGSLWKMLLRLLGTVIIILAIAGVIVSLSVASFVFGMKDESIKLDLNKLKLNYTSFIYVNNENGKPAEYQRLSGTEDRVWVNFSKIPQDMKDAMVAIEDKRFREHEGVDWRRTLGAVTTMFTSGTSYGGSTITQQLVKNLTGEGEVSLTRKVKEIFRALNLEKKYTKDEILETYLNVVNFGNNCQGVQAAANLYFGKTISQCDAAECAAIAGITQNPAAYNPLLHPQANMKRQQTVLGEMYGQGYLTETEYKKAMQKSEHMVFVGKTDDNVVDNVDIWDWYTDDMFEDVVADLEASLNISEKEATNMMYHGGLKIYSAMDQKAQITAEEVFKDAKVIAPDSKIQAGMTMMAYDGRVLATVGRRGEKAANRLFSYATDTQRQPGSTIKPLSVYGPAVDQGIVNYSSMILDEPLENYFGPGKPGPSNAGRPYMGPVTVKEALERSLNAPAVRLCQQISPLTSFSFLTERLHFTHLNPKTDGTELAAMALGGMNGGVTVREMTSGYQIFGNGGKYYKPYTYYYVEDHDGNVILDNRKRQGTQVITSASATVMHKLLENVVYGPNGTGTRAAISGWEVYGKTGTTDDDKDSWFVGGTPYAVIGVWTGYVNPSHLPQTRDSLTLWKETMTRYLKDKQPLSFTYDSNVVSATYCNETGLLASASCTDIRTGWYERDNMPGVCDGNHPSESSALESSTIPESGLPESVPSTPTPDYSVPIYEPSSSNSSGPNSDPFGPGSSSSSSSGSKPEGSSSSQKPSSEAPSSAASEPESSSPSESVSSSWGEEKPPENFDPFGSLPAG